MLKVYTVQVALSRGFTNCFQLAPKRNHPPIMSFRANAVSRGIFPSGKFYLVVAHHPTWWIPPLRLRSGRNDTMGLRFYEFAYCFQNVSRRPAASSVRASPCQLPRRGSFCTVIWGGGFYRAQFRPFTHGTAHRPFPTVSLVGGRFQPMDTKDRRDGAAYCQNGGHKGKTSVLPITVNCQLSTVN